MSMGFRRWQLRRGRGDLTKLDDWWNEYGTEYSNRTWRDSRNLLADAIRHAPGPPLVDVGCGYGFVVEAARRFGISSVGLEASRHALDTARRVHPGADIREWHSGDPLPFENESIGVVLLNEVVDHFALRDNQLLFGEIFRTLVFDGAVVVRSPSRFNRFDDDRGHVTFFSPREFAAFVTSFGFTIIDQPYTIQPLLGRSRVSRNLLRLAAFAQPEWLTERIDLVAIKKQQSP
jgi:SAM-dependent methyltransferase